MQYHHNAKTNINQRIAMRISSKSSRELARKYEVSHITSAKWKKREEPKDRSSRPNTIHYAVDPSFWRIIKVVRKRTLLSLDDLVEVLEPYISKLNRDNCFRILKHYKLNRLSFEERRKSKKFASYKPGFLHLDVFYLPKILENGLKKRFFCFLAIDRATRLLFLEIYPRKGKEEAADFVLKCLNFFPYRIHHLLTDNGKEFSLKGSRNRFGKIEVSSFVDIICQIAGIKHRLTKIRHPWTNGMAERAIKTVKDHTIRIHHYQNIEEMKQDLKAFEDNHNFYRRLKVLNRKTPYEVTMEWFVKEPEIFLKNLKVENLKVEVPTVALACKQPCAT